MHKVTHLSCSPNSALHAALDASRFGRPDLGVVGLGLDLVTVEQVDRLVTAGGNAFLERAWTATERAEANGDLARLATRWAAKEAVMKCLGLGLADIDPLEVEVLTDPATGAPTISFRGTAQGAADSLGITEIHISASHENGWAAALAVATNRQIDDLECPEESE